MEVYGHAVETARPVIRVQAPSRPDHATRLTEPGGGASKSQPRPTIAGRPIYMGGRKPAVLTCRDEVVAAVEALAAGGQEQGFNVEVVHAAMDSCGSRWPRQTVAKAMLGMTRPARRPPYLQLERAGPDL